MRLPMAARPCGGTGGSPERSEDGNIYINVPSSS